MPLQPPDVPPIGPPPPSVMPGGFFGPNTNWNVPPPRGYPYVGDWAVSSHLYPPGGNNPFDPGGGYYSHFQPDNSGNGGLTGNTGGNANWNGYGGPVGGNAEYDPVTGQPGVEINPNGYQYGNVSGIGPQPWDGGGNTDYGTATNSFNDWMNYDWYGGGGNTNFGNSFDRWTSYQPQPGDPNYPPPGAGAPDDGSGGFHLSYLNPGTAVGRLIAQAIHRARERQRTRDNMSSNTGPSAPPDNSGGYPNFAGTHFDYVSGTYIPNQTRGPSTARTDNFAHGTPGGYGSSLDSIANAQLMQSTAFGGSPNRTVVNDSLVEARSEHPYAPISTGTANRVALMALHPNGLFAGTDPVTGQATGQYLRRNQPPGAFAWLNPPTGGTPSPPPYIPGTGNSNDPYMQPPLPHWG